MLKRGLATVFANLLEGRVIEPIDNHLNLILRVFWGFAISIVFCLLPGVGAVVASIVLASLYLAMAGFCFGRNGIWLPVVSPLLFQLPFALLGALTWQYVRTQKGARYYLPDEVVDALSEMRQDALVNAERVIQGGMFGHRC